MQDCQLQAIGYIHVMVYMGSYALAAKDTLPPLNLALGGITDESTQLQPWCTKAHHLLQSRVFTQRRES